MEISAEINKIFANEMASIFSQKITDEEIEKTAREAWVEICKTQRDSYYGGPKPSILTTQLQKAYIERLDRAIESIMNEEVTNEFIMKKAHEIVSSIRKSAEEKIIEVASDSIVHMYRGPMLDGYAMANIIADAIRQSKG